MAPPWLMLSGSVPDAPETSKVTILGGVARMAAEHVTHAAITKLSAEKPNSFLMFSSQSCIGISGSCDELSGRAAGNQ
jgi:hypothetical protein